MNLRKLSRICHNCALLLLFQMAARSGYLSVMIFIALHINAFFPRIQHVNQDHRWVKVSLRNRLTEKHSEIWVEFLYHPVA